MNVAVVPLRDIVVSRPGTRDPATSGRESFIYVDIDAVDRDRKTIVTPKAIASNKAPSRARKIIRTNDVLVGLVRPNLNAVALVPPELDNQIASTGFGVLRATERVLPEYLYFFVRSGTFVDNLSSLVSGAMYPAVTERQLLDQKLFLPSIEEQKSIVDLLSRAANIVRMRREAEARAKEIIPALFLDMFGDPATNPRGWPVHAIADTIQSAEYGTSTKASSDGSGVAMIRMGNVDFAGRIDLDALKYVVLSEDDRDRYRLQVGDILFNRTNSKDLVGKTGIWRGERDAVAASYFIRVRVDGTKIDPDYLWAFLNCSYMKQVLFGTARGAIGQSNINAQELRAMPIPVPMLGAQRQFSGLVGCTSSLEKQQTVAMKRAEITFQSMLAGVFGNGAPGVGESRCTKA